MQKLKKNQMIILDKTVQRLYNGAKRLKMTINERKTEEKEVVWVETNAHGESINCKG